MNDDLKNKCAQALFAEVAHMLASQENCTELEAKTSLITSGTFDAMFNFDTNLWRESPEYILAYHRGLV